MDNEKIVNSIKSICKEHDVSITKLEETLGMSQGLISRWNKSDPSLSKIIDIADYFKISLDEVVGYNNVINDAFIKKLLSQTSNRKIKWNPYNDEPNTPKQYYDSSIEHMNFLSQEDANEYFENHTELSYYTCINKGFISIYGAYDYNDIKKPNDIMLFIQPGIESDLIFQDYTKEQLIPLWLKILYTLDEDAPDEIKAEELKHAFVSEDDEKTNLQKNEQNSSPDNDSLAILMKTFNTPEFQILQQTLTSPEFQKAIQVANKMQKEQEKLFTTQQIKRTE